MVGKVSAPPQSRSAGELDRKIGENIRQRRLEVKMSQEGLAEKLGITFQQVQKYEKGVNRVSAATLFHITKILDVSLAEIFPSGVKLLAGESDSKNELMDITAQLSAEGRETLIDVARTMLASEKRRAKKK